MIIIALVISAFIGFLSISMQRYLLNQMSKQDQKKTIFVFGFGTTLGVFLAIMIMFRLKLPVSSFVEFIIQIVLVLVVALIFGKVMNILAPKKYKELKAKERN